MVSSIPEQVPQSALQTVVIGLPGALKPCLDVSHWTSCDVGGALIVTVGRVAGPET